MHAGEVVGDDLEHRRRAERTRVNDLSPHGREHGQHLLEGVTLAAREDRDVAGSRPVATSGNRRIQGQPALGLHQRAKSLHFIDRGGGRLEPNLALGDSREDAVGLFENMCRDLRGRQTGDDHVAALRDASSRLAPRGAGPQQRCGGGLVDVPDRQVEAVAQQTAGQLGTDIPQTNETDLHLLTSVGERFTWFLISIGFKGTNR